MIIVYLFLLLWVGRLGHVSQSRHTAADFYVAERSMGPFLLIMSIFGTTMTAFALTGSTGESWQHGIGVYGLMASWSGIIHSACFFLIGIKLWHFGKKFGYNTQIQYFRDRFQSPALGMVLFPIIVGLVVPYIVINILGAGNTIESLTRGALPAWFPDTQGGIPHHLGAAAVCAVVLIYVFGGGVRSTAWANVVQTSVFMVLGLVALVVIAVKLGGPAAASQRVAEMRPDLLARGAVAGHEAHFSHLHFMTYIFVPLSVAMFPHLFQHWMTAKSAKTFRPTVTLHPVFIMLVWAPCVLLGVWASAAIYNGQPVIPPDLKNPNAILGAMVVKLTNPFLAGVLAVGIVAATLSLDSQFLCLATMFTHDIVLHYTGEKRFSDQQQIWLGRTFVVLIVVAAYLLSLGAPKSVFDLGVWCFSGFSSLFPLVFASLYWRRVTKAGAVASILTTAAVWLVLFRQADWGANGEYLFLGLMPVVTIVAASTVSLIVVSLLTRPPEREVVDRFFPPRSEPASGAKTDEMQLAKTAVVD
jgi:SSS family solute:Na+ symporter